MVYSLDRHGPGGVAVDQSAPRVTIVSDAGTDRNGVGSYYRDLVGHLEGRLGGMDFMSPTRKQSGVYIMSLPLPGDPTQKVRVPHVPRVARRVRNLAPHVIVVPSPGPFGLLGLALARRHKVPLCVGLHTDYDCLAGMYWTGLTSHVTRRYLRRVNQLLVRSSSAVLAATDCLARKAGELGAPRAEVVASPVAAEYLTTRQRGPTSRIETVLFAGRLAPEKNIPAVIDAARAMPDVTFRVAGDGPLRRQVQRAAVELANLDYLGWVPRHKLMNVVDGADLVVLPSHVESFGTVALEAMARQRLALVSRECGLLRWRVLAEAALTMDAGETLAQAIGRVRKLDAAETARLQAQAGRAARVLTEQTVRTWEATFRDLSVERVRSVEAPGVVSRRIA